MPNLFPVGDPAASTATPTTTRRIKFGRSWKFDHATGDFATTGAGKVVVTTGQDAWIEWCVKAMKTARYRYLAYSRAYGQEFDALIAQHLTRAGNESEIRRITTETLMRDPRTERIGEFSFEWDGDECYFTFDAHSVRNEVSKITERWSNNG